MSGALLMGSVVAQNGIGVLNKGMDVDARAESNQTMADTRDAVLRTLTRISRSETPEFQKMAQGKPFKVTGTEALGNYEAVKAEILSEDGSTLSYILRINGTDYHMGRSEGEFETNLESVKRALDPSLNARSPITKILASNEKK